MTNQPTDENPEPLGAPDESRGGEDVEAAVENAEAGSDAEGTHTPVDDADIGESRLEQMREVDPSGTSESRGDETAGASDGPPPGPGPADVGSGGAQRIVGARISDRVSAGEPVPDGPPFDDQEPRQD